ncbi:MAG: hypothetical protein ACFB8W_23475 [Elainellaceae cyanobacterium]
MEIFTFLELANESAPATEAETAATANSDQPHHVSATSDPQQDSQEQIPSDADHDGWDSQPSSDRAFQYTGDFASLSWWG